MKKLKKALWWLIYHPTNQHLSYENNHSCLNYKMYRLYRVDRVIGFKYKTLIDKCCSLGSGELHRNRWYYDYQNVKQIN